MRNKIKYSSPLSEEYNLHFCIKVLASCLGKSLSIEKIDEFIISRKFNAENVLDVCQKLGFGASQERIDALGELEGPYLLQKPDGDWITLVQISKRRQVATIQDPVSGELELKIDMLNSLLKSGETEDIIGIRCHEILDTSAFLDEEANEFGLLQLLKFLEAKNTLIYKFLLVSLLLVVVQVTMPFLSKFLIDQGLQVNDMTIVVAIALCQIGVVSGRFLIKGLSDRLVIHLGLQIGQRLYSKLFDSFLALAPDLIKYKSFGVFQVRAQDVNRIQKFLSDKIPRNIIALLLTFTLGIILLVFSWEVFLVYLFFIVFEFSWIGTFDKRIKSLLYTNYLSSSGLKEVIIEFKTEIQDLKIYQKEQYLKDKLQTASGVNNKNNLTLESIFLKRTRGTTILNDTRNISITTMLVIFIINGHATLGDLFAIQFITGQLNWGIDILSGFSPAFQDFVLFKNRHEEFDQKSQKDNFETHWDSEMTNSIELRNINFGYKRATQLILQDLSLKIPSNKITVIAGPNGSGKSTVLRIISTILTPNSGEVRYQASLQKNHRSVRENIAFLSTESVLIADTILFNITLGEEGKEAFLEEVLDFVRLKELIGMLPHGIHTLLGKDGVGLSKGQEQKVLLARTIFSQRDILILDEPSSYIDQVNGDLVHEMILKYYEGKTVIITTHDKQLGGISDYAIILEEGVIVEQGKTKELLKDQKSLSRNLLSQPHLINI